MAVFGCDIGNCNAYVSVLERDGSRPECAFPPEVPRAGMPTAAYVMPDGTVSVDDVVVNQERSLNPGRVVSAIKRLLDQATLKLEPASGSDASVDTVKPQEVYAAIAQRALDLAFNEMSERGRGTIHDVVLTYPAILARAPRLIDVMSEAVGGLVAPDGAPYKVVGRIPEPAAVALDFLAFMRREIEEPQRIDHRDVTVIVYDLGHGTFDTALVTARAVEGNTEKPWDVHDHGGNSEVGGVDFDFQIERLLQDAADSVAEGKRKSSLARDTIRRSAVKCKHDLTNQEEARTLFLIDDQIPVERTVTRREFEELTSDLLDKTIDQVGRMLDTAGDLDLGVTHLVLSGGASQMPMVKAALEKLLDQRFGTGDRRPAIVLHRPSEAVSFGAARYGMQLSRADAGPDITTDPETELVQHAVRDTGVALPDANGRYTLRVMVEQGKKLPAVSERLQIRTESEEPRIITASVCERRSPTAPSESLPLTECQELGRLRPATPLQSGDYELELQMGVDGSVTCLLYGEDGSVTKSVWQ